MKILKNTEIYSLVSKPFKGSNPGLSITPFDINSLNQDSYTLHAGSHILTHRSRGNERKKLDNQEGLFLSPNLIYTIEILERIETMNLTTLVYGPGVLNSERIGENNSVLVIRFSPLQPQFISNGDKIANIRFILLDDRQKIDISEKSKENVDRFINQNFVTLPSRINTPGSVRER